MLPITENDFNNFKDTIIDKHNRPGYLIYRDKYYIFQPSEQNEDVPIYYRTTATKHVSQKLSLYNYLKSTSTYQNIKDKSKKSRDNEKNIKEDNQYYNFEDAYDYYESRDEYDFVGYIDKEISRRKNKAPEEIKDVFKLREKRAKILEKKRATGIPSIKGAVCQTSKSAHYLKKVAESLGVTIGKTETRGDICKEIENKMLFLEKYSTDKDKNKVTYVMIPVDHPKYPFPYNLEDRTEYIIKKIKDEIKFKLNISIKTKKKISGPEKGNPSYEILIKNDAKLNEYEVFLKKLGAKKEKDDWIIMIE